MTKEGVIETEYPQDPVTRTPFPGMAGDAVLLLRIGGSGQGEGRQARLSVQHAQLLAYALLSESVRIGAGKQA